uniref:transformer-2 protein homolog beta-like n=1 Tax=Myxine glutinosa TaxID=7769 RepID=UPI00358DF4E7
MTASNHPKPGVGFTSNPPSTCLGVFGMNMKTTEEDLRCIFELYGEILDVKVAFNRQLYRSRGYGFVHYTTVEEATKAKEHTNGMELHGHNIRVDYSLTLKGHEPTPGVFKGKISKQNQLPSRSDTGYYDGSPSLPWNREPYRPGYHDRGYGYDGDSERRCDRGYNRRDERRYDQEHYGGYGRDYSRGYRGYNRDLSQEYGDGFSSRSTWSSPHDYNRDDYYDAPKDRRWYKTSIW